MIRLFIKQHEFREPNTTIAILKPEPPPALSVLKNRRLLLGMFLLNCSVLLSTLTLVLKCNGLTVVEVSGYSYSTPVKRLEDLWDMQTADAVPASRHFKVEVDVSKSLHVTQPHYISVNIDARQIMFRFRGFNFR